MSSEFSKVAASKTHKPSAHASVFELGMSLDDPLLLTKSISSGAR